MGSIPRSGIPWRRARQPTSVYLPGESWGQRSLVDYSPWCHKGSHTTEPLNSSVKIVCFVYRDKPLRYWLNHRAESSPRNLSRDGGFMRRIRHTRLTVRLSVSTRQFSRRNWSPRAPIPAREPALLVMFVLLATFKKAGSLR